VHGAHGVDQVGPENVGCIASLRRDADDLADAAEHPVATATLKTGVRVPDTPEATIMPLTLSLPLVEAAAGKAVVARLASAIPAASSAPCDLVQSGVHPGTPGREPWHAWSGALA
jgi:hypothetical protein